MKLVTQRKKVWTTTGLASAILLVVFLFASASVAASLSRQRLDFERELQSSITLMLEPLIPKTHFIVQVASTVRPKPTPAPLPTPTQAVIREEDLAKNPADDASLLLSKLGVVSPPISLPPPQTQAGGVPEADTEIEFFDYLSGLEVTLTIDSTIPDTTVDIAKRLTEAKVKSLSDAAKVTVGREAIAPPVKEATPTPAPTPIQWDKYTWISELTMPASIFLSALLLIIVLFINTKQSVSVEREKAQAMAAQAAAGGGDAGATKEAAPEPAATVEAAAPVTAQAPSMVSGTSGGENFGIERFEVFLEQNPSGAALMIKQWIGARPTGSQEALILLARTLTVDNLSKAAAFLSADERKNWRGQLSSDLSAEGMATAQVFLANQISESVLVPPALLDADIKDLFASITPKESVACAKKDPRIGGVLLNFLNTFQVARMLSLLPQDSIEQVLDASASVEQKDIPALASDAKAFIEEMRARAAGKVTPFLEKAVDLIREVEPDKERALFGAMAKAQAYEMLETLSKTYFPAELITRIDQALMNSLLLKLPAATRAEVIYGRGAEEKAVLLAAIGETGKQREMIDVELAEIEASPARKSLVESRSSATWRRFVGLTRETIRNDLAFANQVEPLRKEWLKTLTGGAMSEEAAA